MKKILLRWSVEIAIDSPTGGETQALFRWRRDAERFARDGEVVVELRYPEIRIFPDVYAGWRTSNGDTPKSRNEAVGIW